jgi:hypothetical protein
MIRAASGQVIGAQMVNATTGAAFAGTVTVYVTGDGGTQTIGAVGSGICTAEGNGYYTYRPTAAETDYILIAFTFIGNGAVPATIQVATVTEAQTVASANTTGGTSITVRNLIKAAMRRINVIQENEDPSGDSLSDAFDRFNDWVDSICGNERLSIYTVTRTTWNLVPSQATYTIGLGGDVNIVRPQFINQINWINANLSVPFEQQLTLLTEDAEASLALKSLTSTYPFYAYYNPTYTGALGSLTIWPTVTGTGLQGALYYPQQVNRFSSVNDTIALPPGYNRFMREGLALELFPEFREGQQMDPYLMQSASEAKANIKRMNNRLMDLQSDPQLMFGSRRYSIYTGP